MLCGTYKLLLIIDMTSFFHNILELDHRIISITPSEDNPKYGGSLTLTCIVRSNVRTDVKWVTENGDPLVDTLNITISPQMMGSCINTVEITFRPLLPSHVGIYNCNSVVRSLPSTKEKTYVISVESKHAIDNMQYNL